MSAMTESCQSLSCVDYLECSPAGGVDGRVGPSDVVKKSSEDEGLLSATMGSPSYYEGVAGI